MSRFSLFAPAVAMMITGAAAPVLANSDAPAAEDANKRICRIIPNTGWRTSAKRVCRTRAEWLEWARANNEDVSDVLRKRRGGE